MPFVIIRIKVIYWKDLKECNKYETNLLYHSTEKENSQNFFLFDLIWLLIKQRNSALNVTPSNPRAIGNKEIFRIMINE